MSSYLPHVIILIGPTASGKTELAIEIAEYFKTRIHNIDSRQIYKSMDIGTAKPSENQQKKIKHFLIDIKEPINPINVKEFQELASSVDAFVLSSPEFHGTMSGVMKNNLDWIYSKHCSGKIFGWFCCSNIH